MRTVVAVLVAFSLTSAPAAAAWIEVRSPHYLFLGDSSRGEMLRIAKRFEQFHSVLEQLLPGAVTFPVPTLVLVFKDARSLRPYLPHLQGKPVDAGGYASTGRELNYIAVDSNAGEGTYAIVFHELAHLMTRNVSSTSASWFSEGIAEYYSTFHNKAFALTLQALETALRRYVQQRVFIVQDFTFPKPIAEADLSAREVSEAVALPHLAALQLRFDRVDAAEKLARAAIASAPRSAAAHAVLASIRLAQEKPDDAKAWLDKDLAFESFLDYYMIASALAGYIRSGDLGSQESRQTAAVMHERDSAAIAAQDDFAEAWRLLADSRFTAEQRGCGEGGRRTRAEVGPG